MEHISTGRQQPASPQSLGGLLRSSREALGLTLRQTAEKADVSRSTLLEIEQDKVAKPHPARLQALAVALRVDPNLLFSAAGYSQSAALPTFAPYLRTKYAGLPPEAQAELSKSFDHIAKKYGYDANGPAPGQDET